MLRHFRTKELKKAKNINGIINEEFPINLDWYENKEKLMSKERFLILKWKSNKDQKF